MILRATDHILGLVGVDMVPPAEDPPLKAMTICFVCFRREGKWVTYIEFLYSRNSEVFSPDDDRSLHPVALPGTNDTDLLWDLLRQCARDSVDRMIASQPTMRPKEFRELRVDGTPDKLNLMLTTSPDPLLRTFLTGADRHN